MQLRCALIVAALAALALHGCIGPPESFTAARLAGSAAAPATAHRRYRLFIPAGLAAGEQRPLVVYLHSVGGKGGDNRQSLEAVPRWLASAENQRAHPCFILVPQCRAGDDAQGRPNNWVKWAGQKENPPAKWEQSEAEPSDQLRGAMAALDDVLARHPIDRARIYLAGVSMGGSASWWWAAHQPERFAGVMTACGLSETSKAAATAKVPVWAFHGADDEVAPIARTRAMVEALRAAGGRVKFSEYSGEGHNIGRRVFAESSVLAWLFDQRRTPQP